MKFILLEGKEILRSIGKYRKNKKGMQKNKKGMQGIGLNF